MLLLEEYLSFHLPRSVSCRDTTQFCCELSPSPSPYSTVASYHNSVLLFSLTWRLATHAMLEKIQMSQ
ncbi:hypothetical protein DY000_02000919 [Brassica cretica]|uniref:Uncharacterized protein n=1 Tax=Brassica cretica TaxID=69181 RepID=A0ABQ7BUE9_BRACR|nr:hypothetical protein DY000_02000919 [Brassica cretica]